MVQIARYLVSHAGDTRSVLETGDAAHATSQQSKVKNGIKIREHIFYFLFLDLLAVREAGELSDFGAPPSSAS